MRIFIIGYMCSGKTTIAKKIAHLYNLQHLDLDQMFEEKYRISINDFFKKYGEKTFRQLETELLKSTFTLEDVVISTGGGTPCFNNNIDLMNDNGVTIFVEVSPKTVVNRLLVTKNKRPLVEGKNEAELTEFVERHYGERMVFYERAMMTIKGENVKIDKDFLNKKEHEKNSESHGKIC